MRASARDYNLVGNDWLICSLGGIFIALIATLILRFPYVWAGLVTVGVTVGVMSLAAKDFRNYWLAVFVLVLPLDIKKMLIDSEYVRTLAGIHGIPLGELPGPVLYLSDLPFLVLMIHWLFKMISGKEKAFFPKSNWMALAFVAWSGVSLINATAFSYGFFDLLRMLKFYLLYLYVANNVRSNKTVRTITTFLLVGMIFQGAICLYQFGTQDIRYIFGNLFGQQELYTEEAINKYSQFYKVTEESDIVRRASGTVGPNNAEAQYFEFLIPIAFLLWLTTTKFWSYSFNLTTFIFGLTGLIVTFSRGGFVGITFGMVVAFISARLFRLISNRKFLTFLLVGLCVSIAMTPMMYSYFMTRPQAAIERLHLAKVGVEMIKANPILGVGLNNHLTVKPEYDPRNYFFPMPAHNNYILIASEIGIPGLVFFLGFLFLTFWLTISAARTVDVYRASVAVGIFGALVAISVHNLGDHLSYHTTLTLFWFYAGLAGALNRWNVKPLEKTSENENRTDRPWFKKTDI